MTQIPYIFTDTQHSKEFQRLQAIEKVFDRSSQRRIESTGITKGWKCLEVGAGAGSIAMWLAAKVGETGKVVAVDLDTRFISNLHQPNIEILKADIRELALEADTFDLIHTRYVLIHIPEFREVLTKLLKMLKPNGWLVFEEPDFSAARAIAGDELACQSVDRVNQSIIQMFEDRGIDPTLGVKLPAIAQELNLHLLSVENEANLVNGGSDLANMMKLSAIQLAEKYTSTGKSTSADIENYCLFAGDRRTWAVYYATVGVIAQRKEN